MSKLNGTNVMNDHLIAFTCLFPQVCNPGEGGKGVSMSMTNVHSQTNGQQSQACTVTPSTSKHGSIGLDDLSGGSKKRSKAGGGAGKDTMTQSSDSSLPDCSTATSVLSQSWAAEEREKVGEERAQAGVSSPTASSLTKPKRKPAPSKPGSACSNNSATPETLPNPSPRPPSSSSASTASSALLPSSIPLENLNTNRNNSTSLDQSPPPYSPSFFSSAYATPSPVPSTRFRETPILRRAPRASAKYQTLPVEEEGRSRARRRYSLSEGGGSKTHSLHQGGGGGGAPKLGRIMRNKRSQSMSGMLLPKDGDGDSDKGRCESDWILESTV